MATGYTAFGALSAAQKKVWAVELWMHGRDDNFWMSNGFVGSNDADMNRPIQRITKLTRTERGRVCIMQLVLDLVDDGVVDDNQLEGNEEQMFNDAIEIRLSMLRHAVKSRGQMSEQETVIQFRSVAKEKLSFWMSDTLDELMFLTVAGRAYTLTVGGATRGASQLPNLAFAADLAAASSARIIYAGTATSEATLTAADKMSWELLVRAHAYAKRQRLRPIRSRGKTYYAVVLSTEQCRDLKLDTTYTNNLRNAGVRGDDNPLFRGAVAVIDGLIIYDHQKVFSTLDGTSGTQKWGAGANVDGAQAQMLGAQAMGFATIGDPKYEESDNTDYKNRQGIGFGRMFGLLKPQFKSPFNSNTKQDFGTIAIKTAAAA